MLDNALTFFLYGAFSAGDRMIPAVGKNLQTFASTSMEYSLRRYEAVQRLFWFVFFLLCLGIAYPVTQLYHESYRGAAVIASADPQVLRTSEFWAQRYWLGVSPFGKIILYLLWMALLFLAGKFLWLLLQHVGKRFVESILKQSMKQSPGRSGQVVDGISSNPKKLVLAEPLLRRVREFPLRFLFHPFQRLRSMLSTTQEVLSAEDLTEKERRIVEIDWQVFWSSWAPFRWLLWLLPLLALLQTFWLIYLQIAPAVAEQKEIDSLLGPVLASLLPVGQMIVVVIILNLVSGLFRRLENLYLSGIDALFYEQLLSKVPFQSGDTLVILNALQKHFKELQAMLRRMEVPKNGENNATDSKP
jgi:hypothetical protein